jgi:hypothetical protein
LHEGYAAAQRDVAGIILQSDEYFARQVRAYYNRFLGRPAGPGEVARWVASLRQGATHEDIISVILGSEEYFRRVGSTNKDWLDRVFFDVFNRVRDPDPSNELLVALNNGTPRVQVAVFITNSFEYRGRLVTDFFRTALKRLPSEAELAFGQDSFRRGARDEQLLAVVLASEEYFQGVRTFP